MTTHTIETIREVLYQIEETDGPVTTMYTDSEHEITYTEIWGLGESTVCDTCDADVWEGVLLLDGGDFWCESCFNKEFKIAEDMVADPF